MFDISWGELVAIGIVALIVIGPQQLPGALRGLGRTVNKLRSMAGEFRGQFDDAMREAELQDVAKDVADLKTAASGGFNPVDTIRNEIRNAVDGLKDKASQATGMSEAEAALLDVSSTLKAAEYDIQTAHMIDAMVSPAPLPAEDGLGGGDAHRDTSTVISSELPLHESPPTKPRRKKSVKPSEPEGASNE